MTALPCPYCTSVTTQPGAVRCPQCGRHAIAAGPASNDLAHWAQVILGSTTFRREIERLRTDDHEGLPLHGVEPLPPGTPPHADDLGSPLASVRLRGESLCAHVGSVALLALLGLGMTAAGALLCHDLNDDRPGAIFAPAGLILTGLGTLGLALWVALRPLQPARTLWVCPGGVLWEEGGLVRCRAWDELRSVHAGAETGRPWVRVLLDGVPIYLSAAQSPAALRVGTAIEARASAELLTRVVLQIASGASVPFGTLRLDADGVTWRGAFAEWARITAITAGAARITIDLKGRRRWARASYREVPFPRVLLALARLLRAQPPRGAEP